MNEKLQKIFAAKFNEMSNGVSYLPNNHQLTSNLTRKRIEASSSKLRKRWKDYLANLDGVSRMGKLMSMVIDCPSDKIQIIDPFGEDAIIRVNKEVAIKIVTLGYIP